MKSSEEARDLIRGLLRRGKRNQRTLRQVARLLGLSNHAQVQKILSGEMRDTLAMKAALRRADRRWYSVKAAPSEMIDEAALSVAVDELQHTLDYLKSLLPKS